MKDQIPEVIGMAIYIGIAVLALFVALVWIVFPFIVNSHAKKITSLLADINTKLQIQESLKQQERRASYSKCNCAHCGQPIEFQTIHSGNSIQCPHCKNETMLVS